MTILLNDGTALAADWCGASGGMLVLAPSQPMTIPEAAALLTPERMARVIFRYGEMADEHLGYTEFAALRQEAGLVVATFRKAVDE